VSTGDLSRRFPGPAIPPAHPKPPKTAPRAAPSNGSLIAASTATRAPRHFSLRIFVDRPPRRRSFFLSPVATLIGASLGKAKAPTPTTPLPLRAAEEEPQSLNPARTAEGPNADLVGPAAAAPSGGGRGARAPRGRCQAGRGPAGARRSRGPRRGCGDQGAPEEGLGGAARGTGPVRLHHRPGALPPLRRERPPPDKHRSPSRLGMVALQHMDFFRYISLPCSLHVIRVVGFCLWEVYFSGFSPSLIGMS